jgi:hypothetical protein
MATRVVPTGMAISAQSPSFRNESPMSTNAGRLRSGGNKWMRK